MKSRHTPILVSTLLATLLASGCASLPKGPGCVQIGPRGAACLLPPAALPEVQASHVVTIQQGDNKDTFLGRLGINRYAMRLAASSLFGTHLFSIDWDGHTVTLKPAREGVRPRLIVAMLQAAITDPEKLRPQLHGIEIVVTRSDDGSELRELRQHGHLVALIRKSGPSLAQAHISIQIAAAKLKLDLKPLEQN